MRPFERRETDAYPYFKLATWDDRAMVWKAGKTVQETEAACLKLARKPGKYRVSRFDESGPVNLDPFEVTGPPAASRNH
jgi:hypothetical protein